MKMVIGGAYQGKLAWAKEYFQRTDGIKENDWIDGKVCEFQEIKHCRGIYDFHAFLKRMMKTEETDKILSDFIMDHNPNIVIVSNEIGYGLVPIDAFEREYREYVGRVCTELAKESDLVVRIVMGNAMAIKGEIYDKYKVRTGASTGNREKKF